VIVRRLAVIAAAVSTAAALLSPSAVAAPTQEVAPQLQTQGLPTGWALRAAPSGRQVTWTPDQPVRLGDARVEFWLDGRLLGVPTPSPDGSAFTLTLTEPLDGDLATLEVRAAGRRLDREQPPSRELAPAGSVQSLVDAQLALPTLADDPGERGPYATQRQSYELTPLKIGGYRKPIEVIGEVVRPLGTTGARPLVLVLHGWHDYCYGDGNTYAWPCPTGTQPVPNHLGYLQTQRLLASQGFVTVSIRANAINAQDNDTLDLGATARGTLVRHHLRQWAQWASGATTSPLGGWLTGGVDLQKTVLVGHSRGGEGVNRAAIISGPADPWRVVGQVLIGPTSFGAQVSPGTPTAVLLPYCDGDVFDLQGQRYVDASRDLTADPAARTVLRSSVIVAGANHNFFNREWTPGVAQAPAFDDWGATDDRMCGTASPVRLTATEQRQVGATYVAAAVRAFTQNDEQAVQLLDGTGVRAASVGDAVVRSTTLGADRSVVLRPRSVLTTPESGGAVSRVCLGWGGAAARCRTYPPSPHWLPILSEAIEPAPRVWEVAWTAAGGRGGIDLPAPVDLTGWPDLELRAMTLPGATARLRVRLVDGSGASAWSAVGTVAGYPAAVESQRIVATTLRLRSSAFAAIDRSDVRRIELVPVSPSGRVWVLDASARRPGLPPLQPVAVPRLDVPSLTVDEGAGGTRTVTLRVALTGTLSRPARVVTVLTSPSNEPPVFDRVSLPAGASGFDVPVTFEADRRDDFPLLRYQLTVKAVSEVTTARYTGSLTVRDDDPSPRVTVDDVSVSAREGDPLRWTFRLPTRSDRDVFGDFDARAVTGEEVRLADLTARWRGDCVDPQTALSTRLSQVELYCLSVGFRPGTRTATLTLPTLRDGRAERRERVRLVLVWQDPRGSFEPGLTLTGVVRDR
jgi:hypothetical protein